MGREPLDLEHTMRDSVTKYTIRKGYTETATGREIPLYHVVDRNGLIVDCFSRLRDAKYYRDLWNRGDAWIRNLPRYQP